MTARLQSNSTPSGDRLDNTPIESTHAEEDNEDTYATPLQSPSSTCTPSPSFYEERFESTYVEDCASIKEFLEQLHFWRALMKGNGKDIDNSCLIRFILARLPSGHNEPCLFFTFMLHSYAFRRKVTLDEVDRGLRAFEFHLQKGKAKDGDEKEALNPEFLEHGLKFTHLGDCSGVEDYLGRMYFWRRSLEEHGKEVSDSKFLAAIVKGLTLWYTKIGAHYLMLRSTPAFKKETLEEFACRLLALEGEIWRFNEYEPETSLIDRVLEDFRYRRGPVNVMDIDWKVDAYFGVTTISFLLGITAPMPIIQPIRGGVESVTSSLCLVGLLVISRHLVRHVPLCDMAVWIFLSACLLGLNRFSLISSFACYLLGFTVFLPLIVLVGLYIAQSRGRVRGCRRVKIQ